MMPKRENSPIAVRAFPKRAIAVFSAIVACLLSIALSSAPYPAASSAYAADETPSGQSASSADDTSAGSSSGADADAEDENSQVAKDPSAIDANLVDPTQRADNSFIYDTTIESLFDQASLYEGSTVQVVGEVIGDLIRAEGQSDGDRELYWITLTSMNVENSSSISVLLTAEQAKQIDHFGKYGVTGTTLQVRGTYHQACAEHQGLPDIHATNSAPIARGVEHPDSFRWRDFIPGVIAVLIGAVLMAVYYFAQERSR